jgi:hypothetical protein
VGVAVFGTLEVGARIGTFTLNNHFAASCPDTTTTNVSTLAEWTPRGHNTRLRRGRHRRPRCRWWASDVHVAHAILSRRTFGSSVSCRCNDRRNIPVLGSWAASGCAIRPVGPLMLAINRARIGVAVLILRHALRITRHATMCDRNSHRALTRADATSALFRARTPRAPLPWNAIHRLRCRRRSWGPSGAKSWGWAHDSVAYSPLSGGAVLSTMISKHSLLNAP